MSKMNARGLIGLGAHAGTARNQQTFRRFALAVGSEEIAAVQVHAEDQEKPSNP